MLSDCDRQQGFQCTCHQQACFSSVVLSWSFSSFFDLIQTHWSSFQIHWSFFQNHWRSSLNPHCFPPRSHCPILYILNPKQIRLYSLLKFPFILLMVLISSLFCNCTGWMRDGSKTSLANSLSIIMTLKWLLLNTNIFQTKSTTTSNVVQLKFVNSQNDQLTRPG